MIANRCKTTTEHDFHHHEVEVTLECSGKTSCGVTSHGVHQFTRTETHWCPGICGCGMRKEVHGPGAHK